MKRFLLPPHDRRVYAEFADDECPRCRLNRWIEVAVVLVFFVFMALT